MEKYGDAGLEACEVGWRPSRAALTLRHPRPTALLDRVFALEEAPSGKDVSGQCIRLENFVSN